MVKIVKPEKKNTWISAAITPSMADKFEKAAIQHEVTKSDLLRLLIENFLNDNLENTEADLPKKVINIEISEVLQ